LTLRAAHVRRRPARENLERAEKPDLEEFAHQGRPGWPARMSLAGWNAPVKPRAPVRRSRGALSGGLAVILAVPFTSAVTTLMDVLVPGHEPPTEQPRRSLRLSRSG
jgi:hypothetical protein